MNREIKFRAFITSTGKMADLRKTTPLALSEGITGGLYLPDKEDWPLMQYTGLKDKNGDDIYEGDIVKCFLNGNKIGALDTIEFKGGAFILRSRTVTLHEWNTMPNGAYTGELEIIGNIYQHPELLSQ